MLKITYDKITQKTAKISLPDGFGHFIELSKAIATNLNRFRADWKIFNSIFVIDQNEIVRRIVVEDLQASLADQQEGNNNIGFSRTHINWTKWYKFSIRKWKTDFENFSKWFSLNVLISKYGYFSINYMII